MASAGFNLVFIGMESGSQAVLDRIQKGIDISRAEEIVSLLRKYGINFRISFLTSTPKETFKEAMQTVRLIKNLKLSKKQYYIHLGLQIYPGTYEFERFEEFHPDNNWLTNNYTFQGKYSGAKDALGNITHPRYREFGIIKSFLF
jgi:radical SAM superfamily enzyme YgiQ (UPF0313 family)